MSDINAAPSSTEPADAPNWTPEQLAEIQARNVVPMQINQIAEAGTATAGELAAGAQAPATGTSTDVSPSSASTAMLASGSQAANSLNPADAPAVGGGVDAPSHLLMLDAMLAEIERKIAAGIHLFAHEVTVARDHLAKLL
ncbi:hypothetical protein [Burkholderia metallica]|uniref:hypothetical protein n=1 Tax=Burkholderia metallica TaxID=488729 RepID=UPI000841399C|nr:hypothetical protein [Burkholderia metallica]AOJ31411.1 hypothetical protein WJ16_07755 [Burkholderia metallica]